MIYGLLLLLGNLPLWFLLGREMFATWSDFFTGMLYAWALPFSFALRLTEREIDGENLALGRRFFAWTVLCALMLWAEAAVLTDLFD